MFLACKPKGMAIDGDGKISGKQRIESVPIEAGGQLAGHDKKTLEDALNESMQKVLKTARGEQADQFGGVPLPNGTTADFGRMDYKIATKPDAWYRYKSEKNSNDTDRSEEVVRALASFIGAGAPSRRGLGGAVWTATLEPEPARPCRAGSGSASKRSKPL